MQEIKDKKYKFNSHEQKIWFTSDTHFGHANIIKFCGRPFVDVEQMNKQLIKRWNEQVGKDDIVFHLGDFIFGGSELFESIISQLNGHIYWVFGNHDYRNVREKYLKLFAGAAPKMVISIDEQPIILNHEPILCFGGQENYRYWHLFGHVHTTRTNRQGMDYEKMLSMSTPSMYDVGVDFNNYRPISWNVVKSTIIAQISRNLNYIEYAITK